MKLIALLCLLTICNSIHAQDKELWKYMTKEQKQNAREEERLKKKANKGDVQAMYNLAEFYMSEKGLREYLFMEWLDKAKATGKCPDCEAKIIERICRERRYSRFSFMPELDRYLDTCGKCSEGSNRMARDKADREQLDSAIYFAKRSAYLGDEEGMHKLATYYERKERQLPKKTANNYREMYMYWYAEAAAKGSKISAERIEILTRAADSSFDRGMKAFKAKDYKTAEYWWNFSASGNNDPSAHYNLALIYDLGYLGERNEMQARMHYESAGDGGIAAGYYFAATIWWRDGFGKPAMEYYKKADAMGYPGAAEAYNKIRAYVDREIASREAFTEAYLAKMREDQSRPTYDPDKFKKEERQKSVCSACHGSGTVHTTVYGGQKGPGNSVSFGQYSSCSSCGGTGRGL